MTWLGGLTWLGLPVRRRIGVAWRLDVAWLAGLAARLGVAWLAGLAVARRGLVVNAGSCVGLLAVGLTWLRHCYGRELNDAPQYATVDQNRVPTSPCYAWFPQPPSLSRLIPSTASPASPGLGCVLVSRCERSERAHQPRLRSPTRTRGRCTTTHRPASVPSTTSPVPPRLFCRRRGWSGPRAATPPAANGPGHAPDPVAPPNGTAHVSSLAPVSCPAPFACRMSGGASPWRVQPP